MTRNIPLETGDVAVEAFFNATQEMLSGLAVNFDLVQLSRTTIGLNAGPGDAQVAISIAGQYRFITAPINRAQAAGPPGAFDVFVTASANNEISGSPPGDNYAFALAIVAAGATPSGVDIFRLVGSHEWTGSEIRALRSHVSPPTRVALDAANDRLGMLAADPRSPEFGPSPILTHGAFFDGQSHPLSGFFVGVDALANAQAVYPFVTSLAQELDWAATTKAIQKVKPNVANPDGRSGVVQLSGRPFYNETVKVVGGVWVRGMSRGGTVVRGATGFAGPFFHVAQHDGLASREFPLGLHPELSDLTIEGNTVPSSAALIAGTPDNRQEANGVLVDWCDWFVVRNVTVQYLKGYHLQIGPVAREGEIVDFHSWRGADMDLDLGAVIFDNVPDGDQVNTIDVWGLHVGWAHGLSLDLTKNGIAAAQNTRYVNFWGGQIEQGGADPAVPGNMKVAAASWPTDTLRVQAGRDIRFIGTLFGQEVPDGKALCRLHGDEDNFIGEILFRDCIFNNAGAGTTIDLDMIGVVHVAGGSLTATTHIGGAHLRTGVNFSRVVWDPDQQIDTGDGALIGTGENDLGMFPSPVNWHKIKRDKLHWELLAPHLENGWVPASGWQAPRIAQDRHGHVWLEGTISGGNATIGQVIFSCSNVSNVFPPAANRKFALEGNGGYAAIMVIGGTGTVVIFAGNNLALSLDGVHWQSFLD